MWQIRKFVFRYENLPQPVSSVGVAAQLGDAPPYSRNSFSYSPHIFVRNNSENNRLVDGSCQTEPHSLLLCNFPMNESKREKASVLKAYILFEPN